MDIHDLAFQQELKGLKSRGKRLARWSIMSTIAIACLLGLGFGFYLIGLGSGPTVSLNEIHIPMDIVFGWDGSPYALVSSPFTSLSESLVELARVGQFLGIPILLFGIASVVMRQSLITLIIATGMAFLLMVAPSIFEEILQVAPPQSPLQTALESGNLEKLDKALASRDDLPDPVKAYLLGQSAIISEETFSPWLGKADEVIQSNGLGEGVEVPGKVAYAIGATLHGSESERLSAGALAYKLAGLENQTKWKDLSRLAFRAAVPLAVIGSMIGMLWLLIRRRLNAIQRLTQNHLQLE